MQHHMASSAPGGPGCLAGQLEGGQGAPPLVLGQSMKPCAAHRCWRWQRPPSDASLGRRPPRPPKVGGSWHLQPAPEAQNKEAPLMLLFWPGALGRRASEPPTSWSMTSEGRSFHLEHSDPLQPGQPAPERRQHPAGRRWGKVERARVAAMRAIQLPEIHSPASSQLASSARGPLRAKGAGQRCHGAKRTLSLNVSCDSSGPLDPAY